jgi:GntR family transcriptional repressor for pyruvate dehydrogenase complex
VDTKFFQSASRTTIGDEVFNQFVRLLGNGVYKPGEKLPTEIEMCRQLGVSRPVLREVTRALCYMGYLTSIQGGGIYVCEFMDPLVSSIKIKLALKKVQLMDVWELRYIVETTVAGIAAERATNDEIADICQAMRDYVQNVREKSDESFIIAASQRFHNAIARAAHNEVLVDVLENVSSLLSMSRETTIKVEGSNDRAVEFHTKIAQAITDRDSKRAKILMEEHLLDVKNDLLISLECEEGSE